MLIQILLKEEIFMFIFYAMVLFSPQTYLFLKN